MSRDRKPQRPPRKTEREGPGRPAGKLPEAPAGKNADKKVGKRPPKPLGPKTGSRSGPATPDAPRSGPRPGFTPRSGAKSGTTPRSGAAPAADNVRRPPVRPPEPVDDTAIYGHHAVAEAWINPARKIRHLLATRAALDALNNQLAAASAAGIRRPAPEIVQRAVIDARLPEGTVHQGVLASVDPLSPPTFESVLHRARERFTLFIVLDQVTDPHNVGAILRTAAAFGAAALIMTERHAPPVSGTLAKIASGAVEHVPIIRVTNMARALSDLTDSGVASLGLAEEAEQTLATAVSGLPQGLSTALVLGSEGAGLRRLTRENCTHLIRLPTSGPIASLNVSNAASAALYELVRNID